MRRPACLPTSQSDHGPRGPDRKARAKRTTAGPPHAPPKQCGDLQDSPQQDREKLADTLSNPYLSQAEAPSPPQKALEGS